MVAVLQAGTNHSSEEKDKNPATFGLEVQLFHHKADRLEPVVLLVQREWSSEGPPTSLADAGYAVSLTDSEREGVKVCT